MRTRLASILLLAAVTSLTACGSDSKSGSNGASSTTKGGAGSGTTQMTTGNRGIDTLLKKVKTSRYKVAYRNDNGDPITIVNDPPKAAFINGDSGLYQLADNTTVMCSGIGATPTCFKSPMGDSAVTTMQQGIFGAWAAILLGEKSNALLDVNESDGSVAGRDARCVHVEAGKIVAGQSGSADICIDTELGIVLSLKSTDGSKTQTVLEATSVGTPAAADTTPPAAVQDLGGTTP